MLKRHRSAAVGQIPTEFIKAAGRTTRCVIHKGINSMWIKVELLEEWKKLILVLVYEKGEKTDCSNYRGIALLSTTL